MRITCVLVDRANYGRLQPVLELLESADWCELKIICGGTTVLPRFGQPCGDISLQFVVSDGVWHEVEGSCLVSTAKSVGLGVIEYTTAIQKTHPDLLLLIGDRYEALAAAAAAHYLRVPILHMQGGEVSGTLDDGARRAITQLARWHVPATTQAANNLMKQGVAACDILAVGCPSADLAARIQPKRTDGPVLVVYHPDTDSDNDKRAEIRAILQAVENHPVDILWPNIDAGSCVIAEEIRDWRRGKRDVHTHTNLEPSEYLQKLAETRCCVGNSSSFVRDAGFFGTPVVLVGDRQRGRQRAHNVLFAATDTKSVKNTLTLQDCLRFEPSTLYGKPGISQQIVNAINETIGNHTGTGQLAAVAG